MKPLITVVLDPGSPDAEVVLTAAYNLACVLAIEAVRQSRDGDWDAMSRKVAAIEQEIEGINETRGAFDTIEKKGSRPARTCHRSARRWRRPDELQGGPVLSSTAPFTWEELDARFPR